MSAKLAIIVDYPRTSAAAEGHVVWGWDAEFLGGKLRKAGFLEGDVIYLALSKGSLAEQLAPHPGVKVLVPLDDKPLTVCTGRKSIHKWHMSPLDTLPELSVRKCIPTFHPDQVKADPSLGLLVEKALGKARRECDSHLFSRKPKRFHLHPNKEARNEILDMLARLGEESWLAVDIETGRGQINTVGFAWTVSDALAINVLPETHTPEDFAELWTRIGTILRGPSRKVFQNGIYETLYFSRYGIRLEGFAHDTMQAQKLLWPEFEKGLANVGRFYTNESYWKDSGRIETEESKVRDWGNITDWDRHLTYNCHDTSGTYEAAINQRTDLLTRGLLDFYDNYLMRAHACMREMCERGFPLSEATRSELISTYETKVAELAGSLSVPPVKAKKQVSAITLKQKKNLLRASGYDIPRIKDRATGKIRESVDELSLKKILAKHPENTDIPKLLKIAEYEKALSSYFRVEADPHTHNIHFMMDCCGTETGRWSASTDPWYRGLNPQTLPKYAKKMIAWPPETNRVFVQIDLKQAESRFVAYDSADFELIQCLEDPKRDIHSEVAAEIFGCSVEQVRAEKAAGNDGKRQLGKKSGHGANYGMAPNTFVDSCLKELDLVITKPFAAKVLDSYHKLFPGIRRWHADIRNEVCRARLLTNPLGRPRYFYGRMDDNTFRQAYAFRPQSTVPDIINHLMLKLGEERKAGRLDFWFHLQCHDSLTLSAAPTSVPEILSLCFDVEAWHPEIVLKAGRLRIPTSVEVGRCLGTLTEIKPGQEINL